MESCTDGLELSPSLVIFFQGCTLKCPGCQNPDLQPLDGGFEADTDDVVGLVDLYRGFYKSVVFSGGDPLEQVDALIDLIEKIKGVAKVLYTGRLYEDLPDVVREGCDIIIDGPYVAELATGGFPASSNQRVIRKN
ncbi:MAG TPA: 4Fe-4S cluster-binding domain-containing protein [Methanothrix sp.]|nr:4Fe-4S cluster-binding domain-containing protein [Methanothrix sp.]HOL44085.1 4Fe-4S cluster-binding domain-containing protein [Methanothrix sp.]